MAELGERTSGYDIPIREGDIFEAVDANGVRATGRYVGFIYARGLGTCLALAQSKTEGLTHIVNPTRLASVTLVKAGPSAVMEEGQTFTVQPALPSPISPLPPR